MSGVAHFFVVVGGSKFHERLAHFFIDIYIPTGNKGKVKLKKLFRQVGKTYHEGKRARALIDSLDMQKIIDTSSAPLAVIENILFELEFLRVKS